MNPELLAKIQAAMDAQFNAGYKAAVMDMALNAALPHPAPAAAETPEPPAIDAA